MIKTKIHIVLLLFLMFNLGLKSQININEIMSSNDSNLQDLDGDFPDWIELYNYSDQEVNLMNYKLSDDSSNYEKWLFPNVIIASQEFLIVFASEKNLLEDELHTNFKISQSGESIYLTNTIGAQISTTHVIAIPSDESLISIVDGSENRVITSNPSPGSSNSNSNSIFCSHASGFYTASQSVSLVSSNPNQTIYYTINGDLPSSNDLIYSEPISITDVTSSPNFFSEIPTTPLTGDYPLETYIWKEPNNVYKSNVIRYASFEDGIQQSKTYTKTWFIDPDIEGRYSMPIVSLVTEQTNLFDYDTGIYVPGRTFDVNEQEWIPRGNYDLRGSDWERDLHISYFDMYGNLGFETDARMRMRGKGSVQFSQKTFGVYFRSGNGLKKIDYPIFTNENNQKYKRIILRNSGSDFFQTHFRDALSQYIIQDFDIEKQAFQPVVSFLNGEYWGIYHIREKFDEFYFKYKLSVDLDSLNIISSCGGIHYGRSLDYINLLGFVYDNDLYASDNYDYVKSQLDISSYADLFIAEIFFANLDWPCNNYRLWKSTEEGAKWRCMIMDLDITSSFVSDCSFETKSIDHAMVSWNEPPHCICSNILFVKLMQNNEFREFFVNRFKFHLENSFYKENLISKINEYKDIYQIEMPEHIARYSYPDDMEAWGEQVEKMEVFLSERPCFMKHHINDYFGLDEVNSPCFSDDYQEDFTLTIYPNPSHGIISINGSRYEWIDHYIMTDIQGKRIMEGEIDNHQFEIDLSILSSGIYLIHVANENQVATGKILISN